RRPGSRSGSGCRRPPARGRGGRGTSWGASSRRRFLPPTRPADSPEEACPCRFSGKSQFYRRVVFSGRELPASSVGVDPIIQGWTPARPQHIEAIALWRPFFLSLHATLG